MPGGSHTDCSFYMIIDSSHTVTPGSFGPDGHIPMRSVPAKAGFPNKIDGHYTRRSRLFFRGDPLTTSMSESPAAMTVAALMTSAYTKCLLLIGSGIEPTGYHTNYTTKTRHISLPRPGRFRSLSLSLFMFWIFANDSDCALTLNDFAFLADGLYRCSNLHDNLSFPKR